jgi:hypothetical protein
MPCISKWTNPVDDDAVVQGHTSSLYGVPAVFALIRKDYKYFYWPQAAGYEQLFHIQGDPYEENDILNSTAQTTRHALHLMQARFLFMKTWAQSGKPV